MGTPSTIKTQLRQAHEAISRGKFDVALAAITSVLMLEPSNSEALRMAMELGERDEQTRLESIERSQNNERKTIRPANEDELHVRLMKARRHLLEKQFDLAQAEVTLAILANPLNEPAQQLEKEIHDGLEHYKKEEATASSDVVTSILLTARRYIEREKFELALEEVNTGLKLDFAHPEFLWLRNTIVEQIQTRRLSQLQERRNASLLRIRELFVKTEFDRALQSLRQAQVEFPSDSELTALGVDIEEAHNKWTELKQFERKAAEVSEYVKRARHLLRSEHIDEALQEIALGLVLDPYNQELKKLENELWNIQSRIEEQRRQEEEKATKEQEFVTTTIHLVAAEEFAMYGQFDRALDEITRAYIVDPLNPEIQRLETRLRLQHQRSVSTPLKLVYKNDQATQSR